LHVGPAVRNVRRRVAGGDGSRARANVAIVPNRRAQGVQSTRGGRPWFDVAPWAILRSPEEFRVWVPAIVARQVEDRGRVETEVVVELVGPGDTFPTAVAHRDSAAVIKAVRVRVVALVGVALVESAVRTARRVSNEGRLVTRAATLVVIVSKPRKAVALGFTRLHLVAFRILGEAHAITIASSAILPLPAFTKGLLATAVICARIREKCAAELAVGSPGAFVALALRTARPLGHNEGESNGSGASHGTHTGAGAD